MIRKILFTLATFLVVGACAFGFGLAIEPESAVKPIAAESPCPVVGCASGECHGFGDVPESDGVHEMACPEAGCDDVACHAWETLQGRYKQASDASLNIWILTPVALVVGLVLLIGALSRPRREGEAAGSDAPSSSESGEEPKGGDE